MNTRKILGAAFVALAATAPAVLQAQQLPAPVIAIVNLDQIFATCTQCAAANTQLQAQANALQARVTTLQNELRTEGSAIEPLVRALNGGAPDAALATRINAFQARQNNAQQELTASRERIERNVNYVRAQIGDRARPAITTVMQQRGATVVMDRGSIIDASAALDITPAVLAIVNQNSTALNVNAPAAAAPSPAGARPPAPAPAQPNRPRPQGR